MRHKQRSSSAFVLLAGGPLRFDFRLVDPRGFVLALTLLAGAGCAPKLGDGCQRTTECSVNGDRTCDRSQPGGYCTIPDCAANQCPDDGVCVRFKPDEPRLSRSWCMAECEKTRDCDRDRYVCRNAAQLNEQAAEGEKLAEVLDSNEGRKFCVVDSQGD